MTRKMWAWVSAIRTSPRAAALVRQVHAVFADSPMATLDPEPVRLAQRDVARVFASVLKRSRLEHLHGVNLQSKKHPVCGATLRTLHCIHLTTRIHLALGHLPNLVDTWTLPLPTSL